MRVRRATACLCLIWVLPFHAWGEQPPYHPGPLPPSDPPPTQSRRADRGETQEHASTPRRQARPTYRRRYARTARRNKGWNLFAALHWRQPSHAHHGRPVARTRRGKPHY